MLQTVLSFAFEAAFGLGALFVVASMIVTPFVGVYIAVRDSFKPQSR